METWVIKLPQADKPDEPILVRVSYKPGGQRLDLDLLATDGESAWSTKVRQRKLDIYRADNYEGTPEEWSSILRYVFIFPRDIVLPSSSRDSLEVVCRRTSRGSKSSLSVTLRTRVEEIERRLGTVELASANTDDVDLFGWTAHAVETRDDISAKFSEKETGLAKAEKEIESLKNRLNELVAAKEEHETQLLTKFTLLLNEKKLRIRTQQRQIAEADRPARSSAPTKSSTVSRKRKRDAKQHSTDTDEESDGFEAMNVDAAHDGGVSQDSDHARRTPSDTETDTDDTPSFTHRSLVGGDQKLQAATTSPPRILPSENRPTESAAKKEKSEDIGMSSAAADDDETASDDDEL